MGFDYWFAPARKSWIEPALAMSQAHQPVIPLHSSGEELQEP
jgi:hypothetical protein